MSKKPRFRLLNQKKQADYYIGAVAILLSLFGLLMIFEASNVAAFSDFGDKYYFVRDQFIWFIIGLFSLFAGSFIHYKKYYYLSVPLLLITIVTLIGVFIPGIGVRSGGASRWIGNQYFSFQPSELAKLAIVIYLSAWLSIKEKKRFFPFLFLLAMIVSLIVLQPDLGTAIVITSLFIVMYFLSGAPIMHFVLLIPLAIASISVLAVTSPYRMRRLLTFLNPNTDPLGTSYHIRQILIAFGSGGFWGLGLGSSRQKYQYLPEATTDSIFAIIGEEFGFVGGFLFIIAYMFLLYRIYMVVKRAPDKQSFLLSGGILTMLGFQAVINLGAMVAIFPLTGIPLPFISYGGSSLVVTLFSIGIILNISRFQVTSE